MTTPPTPGTIAGPPPGGAGVTTLTELIPARLLQAARSNPHLAIRTLSPRTLPDPVLLAVLRAEVHLRLGRRTPAGTEAMCGTSLAGKEDPIVALRVLTAVTVLTDITCGTGDPSSLQVCAGLRELAVHHGDLQRALIADILHAVAVYHHHDCARGHALLTALHDQQLADTPIAAILADGLTTLTRHCAATAAAPLLTRPLGPVPGGLLHPDLGHPPASWLTDRITAHRCANTHTAPPIREA